MDEDGRRQLVEDIIGTLGKNQDRETRVRELQERYQAHANKLAYQEDREAEVITTDYAEEEYAAFLVQEAFQSDEMLKLLAQEKPSILQRVKQMVDDLVERLKGNGEAVEERKQLEALQERFAQALKASADQNAMQDSMRNSLLADDASATMEKNTGEETSYGKREIRTESREDFLRRGDPSRTETVDAGNFVYRYVRADEGTGLRGGLPESGAVARGGELDERRRPDGNMGNTLVAGDETHRGRLLRSALQGLGVPSFVHRGMEANAGGKTYVAGDQATTVRGQGVGVYEGTTLPIQETAGHEAFHYWRSLPERQSFVQTVQDNLKYESKAFQEYQDTVARAYFGGEVDIFDTEAMRKLSEELHGYIAGQLHDGGWEATLRPMLRDYDAVKRAWDDFVQVMRVQANAKTENGGSERASEKSGASSLPESRYSLSEAQESEDRLNALREEREQLAAAMEYGDLRGQERSETQRRLVKLNAEIAKLVGQEQKPAADIRYSINDSFAADIAAWSREGRPSGEEFILGSTGQVLQGLGAIESDIYMTGDKIRTILQDHPEMTLGEVQKIPQMLEDPVLILSSKGTGKKSRNSRMVIYGTVKAQNGQPVMAVLDLRPVENHLVVDDMQKVNSAYTKKNPGNFVTTSDVLHADKKRTIPLLKSMGLQLRPIDLLRSGSMGSVTYQGDSVNIKGEPYRGAAARG